MNNNENISIKSLPLEERPREKLMNSGVKNLSNDELVSIILGAGTKKTSAKRLAERVLAMDCEGLRFLANCIPEELAEIPGIGTAKACKLIAAVEIGRRISSLNSIKKKAIRTPKDAASFVMEEMRYMKHEEFWIILLGTDGRPGSIEKITVGILDEAPVHPREIFNPAIRKNASGIILVHNHPSGNPEPSSADINITKRLIESGKLLGIEVKDHIIIGDGIFVSLKERQIF